MRKCLAALVLVLALALPAQALAKTKKYSGVVDPSGSVSFKTVKKHGKTTEKGFKFSHVPVSCVEGKHTTFGNVTFGVKVKHKQFSISGTSSATGASVDVDAQLSGSSASGTLDVQGDVPLDDGGPSDGTNCATGILNWTASR